MKLQMSVLVVTEIVNRSIQVLNNGKCPQAFMPVGVADRNVDFLGGQLLRIRERCSGDDGSSNQPCQPCETRHLRIVIFFSRLCFSLAPVDEMWGSRERVS